MRKYEINVMKWNLEKYNSTPEFYQKFQILLLMENANIHLVSLFKDYLLFDDMTEFFKEYYNTKELYPRLKTIFDYYESSSYLFPNYTAINEGKYIYRNIIKKQKLIDYLEDLEDKKKEKEEKQRLKIKKNNPNKNENEQSSSCIEVFNTKIYDNIRKETWNDSKINDLFCIEKKNNNESDSLASIRKLTDMIKDKEKNNNNHIHNEKKEKNINKITKNVKYGKDGNNNNKKNNIGDISKNKDDNIKNDNIKNDNNNNSNYINKDLISNNNSNSNNNENIDNNNMVKDNNIKNNQNENDNKIYVSRRINVNLGNNKKYIKKPIININHNINIDNKYTNNINNINNINNNNFITNTNENNNINKNNDNLSNRNAIRNTEPSKSNDFGQNSENNAIQRNIKNNSNNKNSYKKNNIIINIINNNKNNNFNSNNIYFPTYTNNNTNENINKNNNNVQLNSIYFTNCTNTNENNNINTNNNNKNNGKTKKINYNHSTKNNHKIKININTNYIKPNTNIIKTQINSRNHTTKNSIGNHNNSKTIIKGVKKEIKSKLLSFRLKTEILPNEANLIRNLTERIKKKSPPNSTKKSKNQEKTKNAFSPKRNMKKRAKTEITGLQTDIFLFGQPNDINSYNKSINRQILKNINLTNSSKPKNEISLVNKKLLNPHFYLNSNNSKTKIKNKYIKHSSTNSQNLTSIGIINKINLLQIKNVAKNTGDIFLFNKTERTSRNQSKDKFNKMNKTTVKRNYKESFSPKKSQELIYNKINRIKNKTNNAIITSFLKNVNSNKKIKTLKIKRKNNYSNYKGTNINNNNNMNLNYKELISKNKKIKNI